MKKNVQRLFLIAIALLAIAAVTTALSGCVVAGKIDTVNNNNTALTSRSVGAAGTNDIDALRDLEGGGIEAALPGQLGGEDATDVLRGLEAVGADGIEPNPPSSTNNVDALPGVEGSGVDAALPAGP